MTRLINQNGEDVTAETIAAFRKVIGGGTDLRKANTINITSGLVAYDLEAPAKNLYPVLTPLRNRIPRKTRGVGAGDAVHWKEVSAITGSGVKSMGWVPEGQRAARMTITTADRSATYVTLGEEADVTFEAQAAGQGFEDVMATAGMRLLQSMMIKEEFGILGGNRSVALGTPATPTPSASASGGSIAANTYNVAVVALTLEGYLAASLAAGVVQRQQVTGMDNQQFYLNGGSSMVSSTAPVVVGGASSGMITADVTVKKGAVAYAWYVGTAGAERLEAITTINSVSLTTLAGTHQLMSAITDDYSLNATYAFDGFLYSAWKSSLAYTASLATGVDGTGTPLHATGNGSITEIDTMLQYLWDNYRLSPEEIYVSAQEALTIRNLTLTGSGTPLVRYNAQITGEVPELVAGAFVKSYLNPFSVDGGSIIPIKIHPNLPPGTLFAWAQNLPAYYQSANVPNTAEIQCRRDYYQVPWPLLTRANQTGVYSEEVLKVYAPFAISIINNIGKP
jgi:hypothetical protein